MVEHNLAKVRVASSSLVFRSFYEMIAITYAQVAELVDAHVSGACVERHAGSSPVLGTLFVKRASFAEIAQLVEHNLAKVRVASSSLVFRSFYEMIAITYAQVAELVDAHVSGACVERHAGSSPVLGTLFVKRASFAEIAQLVEHNLAKVRVASSSLVFRSFFMFC